MGKTLSIVCDETTDISIKGELSICVRYVLKISDSFLIKERFLGFVKIEDTTEGNLYNVIKFYMDKIGLILIE